MFLFLLKSIFSISLEVFLVWEQLELTFHFKVKLSFPVAPQMYFQLENFSGMQMYFIIRSFTFMYILFPLCVFTNPYFSNTLCKTLLYRANLVNKNIMLPVGKFSANAMFLLPAFQRLSTMLDSWLPCQFYVRTTPTTLRLVII